jgi:polysaccharide pyruvyl transferase WcaK-like protein
MKGKPARVALWNGSGMDNLGDQAIDLVTRRELSRRLPGAEFVTFTPWPGRYCANQLTIDRNGAWDGQGSFDAIVVGGGAILTGPPFRDPSSQFFLLGPSPAKFQDACPVLWNGVCSDYQSLAPSRPEWRRFMAEACARVSYRAVRNERSRRFLEDCGVEGPIDVVPDVAVAAGRGRETRARLGRPRIAVAAGRPVFPLRFISKIAELAAANLARSEPGLLDLRRYDEGGYDDEACASRLERRLAGLAAEGDLVVSAFGEMYGDDLLCEVLARKLRAPYRRLWDGELGSVLDFFGGVDVVVGFRMHSCVLALSAGTPFVMVDPYHCAQTGTSKMKEFALQCGLERFYFTLSDVLEGRADVRRAVQEALALDRRSVASTRERLTAGLDAHFDRLAGMVPA